MTKVAIHYWRGSAEIREDIALTVRQAEIDFVVVRSLEEVLDLRQKGAVRLLVVDGSGGEREASGRILELSNTEILSSITILFVAPQADQRIAPLRKKVFSRLFPLNVPYRPSSLSRVLGRLYQGGDCELEEFIRCRDESSPVAPASAEEAAPAPAPASAAPQPAPIEPAGEAATDLAPAAPAPAAAPVQAKAPAAASRRKTVESNSHINRARLVKHRNPRALQQSHGGEVFAIASEVDDFSDDDLFPKTAAGAALRASLTELAQHNRWAATQTRRGMYVALAMSKSLRLSESDQVALCTVMAALNHSFAGPGPGRLLRRYDLIGQTEQEFVDVIYDTLSTSANWVEKELHEPVASSIMHTVVKIFRRSDSPGDAPTRRLAECAAGIELVLRAAWGGGYWNPYGAYRAICAFRRQDSFISDPEVALALSRVLGEACSAHVTVANLMKTDIDTADLYGTMLKESKERDSLSPYVPPKNTRETKVQIADLVPGMRTAEPLRSRDGRTVLDTAVKINRDLLLQLWQLSAVRALEPTVKVYLEK